MALTPYSAATAATTSFVSAPENYNGPNPQSVGYKAGAWLAASIVGKVCSYVWSYLPSLPGVAAHVVEDRRCPMPEGPWADTCLPGRIKFDLDHGVCKLNTFCKTFYDAMPLQPAQFDFPADLPPLLDNRNATLVNLNAEQALKAELDVVDPKKVAKALPKGSILTIGADRTAQVVAKADVKGYDPKALDAFQTFAEKTGGVMGLSPDAVNLHDVTKALFNHILEGVAPKQAIEVAIVLDTTGSMTDNIEKVKAQLINFTKLLQDAKKDHVVRVGLIQFRDRDTQYNGADDFYYQIEGDLTTQLDQIQNKLSKLRVKSNGDAPEAALDALVGASKLAWGKDAKRVVLLVSDAPPHPKTKEGGLDADTVLQSYKAKGIEVNIYPVLTA